MKRALVLAGHGSHLDPRSSEPLFVHARRLRATGEYSEVRAAFWKEEPPLARAFDGLQADEVVVVPVFMAQGYFTNTVIPREMALDGPVTRRDGHTVRLGPPLGVHPGIDDVVLACAMEAAPDGAEGLAVLGHGTPQDPGSSASVYAVVDRLRLRCLFREVVPVFIEEQPILQDLRSTTRSDHIVLVPYFVGEGWHVGRGLPAALLESGDAGRIVCSRAVGTHPLVGDLLAAIARETSGC